MSQWTHVNASIRFDGIKGMTPDPDLGITVHFDDEDRSLWMKCNVPLGSEGSLQYMVKEVGDGAVRFVALIWGDLREYSNIDEIKSYLDRIVKGQLVRSGIAEICVEYDKAIVLRYDRESESWATVMEVADSSG